MNKILKKASLPFILALISISCNSGRIYHEKYTFEDYSWTKDEKIVFFMVEQEKSRPKYKF